MHSPHTPILTEAHLNHVALFPLPGVVFFPQTMLPLHIFEPRYRELTAEALRDALPIALVQLVEPRQLNALGKPAYHAIGGVGFITQHQPLPDGRFNILLQGHARVRIIEELDSPRPYRVGRAELVPDAPCLVDRLDQLMSTLRGCAVGLQPHFSRLADALHRLMSQMDEPGAVADNIASMLIDDPHSRQVLLEERHADRRLEAIVQLITTLLATGPRLRGDGPLD